MSKLPAFQFYPGDWRKDPDLSRSSKAAKGVWIDMLCLMFECPIRGVLANAGGNPWSDQEIAEAIGGPIGSNLECIAELLGKGVASRDNRGAIFSRRLVRDEEIRRATKERVEKHRSNADVTQVKRRCTEDEVEDKPVLVSLFEKAYERYPKHVGKRAAEKAWGSAVDRESKKRVAPLADHEDFIFQRVMHYGAACAKYHKPREFIPHMATWLNQDRFLDDPTEWEVTSNGNGKPPVSLQEQKLELERTIGNDRTFGHVDPENPNGLTPEALEYAKKVQEKIRAKGAGA